MPIFAGNTTGSITSVARKIPCDIISFTLVNRSGGDIMVNLYIRDEDEADTAIISLNYPLTATQAVVSNNIVRVLKNCSIHIVTTGSLDFYFSLI